MGMLRYTSIILLSLVCTVCASENITIGLMGFFHGHSPVVFLGKTGAAVPIAIETINRNNSMLENYTLSYTVLDTECDRKIALGGFIAMTKTKGTTMVMGPACGAEIEVVGLLASRWNIPMVNYVSVTNALEDKQTYDTLVMLGGNHKQTGDVIRKVVAYLGVQHICLFCPLQMGHLAFIHEGILKEMDTENVTVKDTLFYDYFSSYPSRHHEVLVELKKQCRGEYIRPKNYIFKITPNQKTI